MVYCLGLLLKLLEVEKSQKPHEMMEAQPTTCFFGGIAMEDLRVQGCTMGVRGMHAGSAMRPVAKPVLRGAPSHFRGHQRFLRTHKQRLSR